MDLLDIDPQPLYFDEPLPAQVEGLLIEAAARYGEGDAEPLLLRAYFLAPQQLTVLVGLYRYYFYQHRLEDALTVADRAMEVAAARLDIPADWRRLCPGHLGHGVQRSMGLMRFYLLAVKAAAVLHLRRGGTAASCAMLEKLVELDAHDRIGARALLDVVRGAAATEALAA